MIPTTFYHLFLLYSMHVINEPYDWHPWTFGCQTPENPCHVSEPHHQYWLPAVQYCQIFLFSSAAKPAIDNDC